MPTRGPSRVRGSARASGEATDGHNVHCREEIRLVTVTQACSASLRRDPRSCIAACRLEAKVSAALFTPARWSGWQRGTVAPLPWPVPRSRARWRARCRRPSHGVGAERNSRHAARSGLLSSAPAGSGPATGVPVVWAASGPGHRDQALTFDFAGGSLPPGCHPAGLPESVRPAGGPCEEA